jgi:homoserine dehydrogenase
LISSKNPARRVALLGFGTVGQSVARLLSEMASEQLELSCIYNREIDRKRNSEAAKYVNSTTVWCDSLDMVFATRPDVVVELVGGLAPARDWIEQALRSGISVVTANKQVIASHGPELAALAQSLGVQLLYGAAVAGGVPVIPGLQQGLSGDHVLRLSGILNGTCNFILSKMEAGAPYAEVLAEAQQLGYAEADPVADVSGQDARAKLCILCRVGMHVELEQQRIATQSIADIDAVDFAYARELGCTIRQVSRAQRQGSGGESETVYARVAPMLVPTTSPLAWSHGTQNMVVATGLFGGDVVFSGHGAGGGATAVAVVSDLLAVAQGARSVVVPAHARSVSADLVAPHYLRFVVSDKPGIVSSIAGALARVGANIDSLLQRPGYPKQRLAFVVTTEPCLRSVIEAAVSSIARLDCMLERPLALEILTVDDKDEPTA